MIIPGLAVAFKWLHCILVAQAASLGYNKLTMDSVVISGSGTTATIAGALAVTGVTTATGLQVNGATTITGLLTASTYPVTPARWIKKQAISTDVFADDSYSSITGLTHTVTALADRMYDIKCDTEAVAITNTSYSRVEVSVWDGTTMLSSKRSSFVYGGFSPDEQFVSLESRWTGTLTAGSHVIICKYYLPSVPSPLTVWTLVAHMNFEGQTGVMGDPSNMDCANCYGKYSDTDINTYMSTGVIKFVTQSSPQYTYYFKLGTDNFNSTAERWATPYATSEAAVDSNSWTYPPSAGTSTNLYKLCNFGKAHYNGNVHFAYGYRSGGGCGSRPLISGNGVTYGTVKLYALNASIGNVPVLKMTNSSTLRIVEIVNGATLQ